MATLNINGRDVTVDVAADIQVLWVRDVPSHPSRDQAGRERSLTMTTYTVSRRGFVAVLTTAGGGLLLGCQMGERSRAAAAAAAASPPAFTPNAFIRIGTGGRVT